VSQIPQYVSALTEGRRPLAIDRPVGYEEADRERIMLGLRLSAGIPASEIETWVAGSGDPLLSPDYDSWLEAGILEREQDRVHFTERGFLVSNEVLCRFV
jgi:coproporphyrinogen III oxidase-like Fe-S oxidoreductase